MLQTFPAGYQFVANGEPVKFSVLGRLIGNAVPVQIGELIANSLWAHVVSLARLECRVGHLPKEHRGCLR